MTLSNRIVTICLSLAVIGLFGCDSSTGIGDGGELTLQGRVTDETGFGKIQDARGNVEGAVVTAARVSADGSLNQLEGQATTNADGHFSLQVNDAGDEVVVVAEKADFESRAMVYTRGRSNVTTMPLTAESHAEADVFIEARRQDDTDDVTMADIAAYVTSQVVTEIRSGARAASDIASSIVAQARARAEFVRDEAGEDEAEDARENELSAFARLQADLAAASDADAESEALDAFVRALIQSHTDAGVDIQTQARARQSGRAALRVFGSSNFDMEKQAALLASLATAHAVESSFQAAGASSARLDALAQAREALIADLRASTSAAAIAQAEAEYEQAIQAELAAEANVEVDALTSAKTAMSAARTALNVALSTVASAVAVSEAYAAFYAAAQSSAEASLANATTNASLAAEVLTLLESS